MSPIDPIPIVSARVSAGGVETPYERTGRGRAVVLVLDTRPDDSRAEALMARLGSQHRVFRPELVTPVWRVGGNAPVPERWLREFVEGLGLDRPIVVTDSGPASRLGPLLQDRDRFRAWIEVPEGSLETVVDEVARSVRLSD
jgi:hypothetical protein